jgi:hypothetical protein
MGIRLRWIGVAVALAAAVCVCAGSAGASGVRASGKVAFYPGLAAALNDPGSPKQVPVVRPPVIFLRYDGSVVVKRLRWASWGGSLARATGLYSASNCNPSCATGHRTNEAAQVALWSVGRILGYDVYRCFQLRVPFDPTVDGRSCVKREGKLYIYTPVAGSPLHLSSFLSPDRKIWCVLGDSPGDMYATCGGPQPANSLQVPQHSAHLQPNGQLTTCTSLPSQTVGNCVQNWDPSATVLKAGRVDTIYQYRCQAAAPAVTCTVDTGAAKGKGFTISQTGVTRIP